MKVVLVLVVAGLLSVGCANGAGKSIAKGTVRGASHGLIEDKVDTNVGRGAAHGALSSTHQVVDQNRATK